MQNVEKIGAFYLGKLFDSKKGQPTKDPVQYESKNLTTHAVCVGMTGSGKTGLGIALLEEAALGEIPALIIDPKGDLGNLLLTFPDLQGEDFLPWIDQGEAARKGLTPKEYADQIAKTWKEGLITWDESSDRIKKLKKAVDFSIYTPASQSGLPLAILETFTAPPPDMISDAGAFRDRILSTVSGLLGLLGIDADPIKSKEHILISNILDKAWREQKNLDLPSLIQQIQSPPFSKVGVFDIDTYFPVKERNALAMNLNHLLSSPSFQAWMEGEPLDIQRLLYTKEGKPRHSILYIAHLSDSEKMFFVTLLLNELIAWMRRQSGTSSLRALLYMDEIFGFFPPTATPSSKLPMLTLLKQARAYGLGIVLATQNPVDLDYKGLANCGTWLIGKLQTDRDKLRVLEGLKMTATGESNAESLKKMLSASGNRIFVMHSVQQQEPQLFQTRWTLSYLRGPLTLQDIQNLMQAKKAEEPEITARTNSVTTPSSTGLSQASSAKPLIAADIPEFFLTLPTKSAKIPYKPSVLGIAKLHFVDAKNKIDTWKEYLLIASASDSGKEVQWESAKDITSLKDELTKTPSETDIAYSELPIGLAQAKNYGAFGKALGAFLYQNQTLDLFSIPDLKLTSNLNETEEEFRSRATLAMKEKCETMIAQVRQNYESKIAALVEKVRRAQEKVEKEKAQSGRKKIDTIISICTTILDAIFGVFFGRKKLSRTTISQAGTSIRRAGDIGKEEGQVTNAEETLKAYQQQLQDLQNTVDNEVNTLSNQMNASTTQLEKITIRPKKSDIAIETTGLVWVKSET